MSITLVTDGNPVASIGYWSREEPVAEFAARELQSYVEEISGAQLPVETATADLEDDVATTIPAAVFVSSEQEGTVGPPDSSPSRLRTVADRLAGSRNDAYALDVDGGIVLAGTTQRGTLYAVYALLERLGVEFFAPEFEFYENHHENVPHRDTIEVPDLAIFEEPDLAYRRKHVEAGWSVTADTLSSLVDSKPGGALPQIPSRLSSIGWPRPGTTSSSVLRTSRTSIVVS